MSRLERPLVTTWPKLRLATLSGETEAQPSKARGCDEMELGLGVV